MRIKNKTKALKSLLLVKMFNKRVPLAVRFQLTNKCVLKCKYCKIWNTEQKELSLEQIYTIIDQLGKCGTQAISFSGGEPMLRKDIANILAYTKKNNISTEMNSTGAFIPQRIVELANLDFLKISLDGPEEINDFLRGNNSYQKAIAAAEAAKDNKLNFIFTATLTRNNISLDCINFLLETAKKYGTLVAFQPLKELYHGAESINNLYPKKEDFSKAIDYLISVKKDGNYHLRNSLLGLRHIYKWPKYNKLKCWAGKVFCMIGSDGTLLPCDRIAYTGELPNCTKTSIKEAIYTLPNVACSGCGFCGVLELNFLLAFKFSILKTIISILP